MAAMNIFRYRPGDSLLHAMDKRIQVVSLILLTLASFNVDLTKQVFFIFLAIILYALSRLNLLAVLASLRFFYLLMILIVISRSLSTPGTPMLVLGRVVFSLEGLTLGTLIAVRLLVAVLLGSLLTATGTVSQLKTAIEWFLKPIPSVQAVRISTMMGLVFRFIPLILDEARLVSLARKSRCAGNRKNPAARIVQYSFTLLGRIFIRADDIHLALTARCFTGRAAPEGLHCSRRDWLCLGFVFIFSVGLVLWEKFI